MADPEDTRTEEEILDDPVLWMRFFVKVEKQPGGCWVWLAAIDRDGYGKFKVPGRCMQLAHRVAYEMCVGAIPQGLQLDHLCRNRACVNPAHLEPVTQQENIRRGTAGATAKIRQLSLTQCRYGHPFDIANTYRRSDGSRACRICKRRITQEWRARRGLIRRDTPPDLSGRWTGDVLGPFAPGDLDGFEPANVEVVCGD